jgi:hypothetical protein
MADLKKFFRNQRAICSAEFDQKSMLARELIVNQFEPEDQDSLRNIINHFATSDKAAISLIGILAQVGLAAMAMDEYS